MAAAAFLRLLPRRRATTLGPRIPAAYSKPPYPLRAATAAGGLPNARRAQQLCASPVPSSMLRRLYASEGCARPALLRQTAHHQAMCRLHNLKVTAAATSVLPGSRRMQLSHLLVPILTRHFSSTGNVLPPLRKLTGPQAMRYLKVLGPALLWFMALLCGIWRLYVGWCFHALRERYKMMDEAFETLEKAACLLEEGLYDEAFSMFDQGTDGLLKDLAIYEKGLDDLVKVIGSCDELTLAIQDMKKLRQRVKKMYDGFKNVIAQRKGAKGYLPRMGSRGLEDV